MHRFDLATLARVGIALALGTVLAMATVVAAQGGEINACVAEVTGLLRVVSLAEDCRENETFLTWNITGPPGATGPSGSADLTTHTYAYSQVIDGMPLALGAVCPAGRRALTGGFHSRPGENYEVYSTGPVAGDPTLWHIWLRPTADQLEYFVEGTVWVHCVPNP